MTIYVDVLHVIGKLEMLIGVFCFQNVCNKRHLPFLTNQDFVYCYAYKCSVAIQTETIITCKIIYELEEKCDCILNGPWIEFVFGYHLGILEDFKAKHGLYMKLFSQKKNIWQVCVKFINRSLGFSFMKKEKNN